MNKQFNISQAVQADIYIQLARLEEAGFPADQAIALLLKTNKQAGKQILQMQRFLKLGNTVVDSGYKAGLFNDFDNELLQAGEHSGNIGIIYKQLAKYYGQKVKRAKKVKSQCYLPIAVLVIGVFVQPIPLLFINEITTIEYFQISISRLLKIVAFITIVIKTPYWLTQGKLQVLGLSNLVYFLQLKLPFISNWIITRQLNEFLLSLGLMLAAGVAILDALPKSINAIQNPLLKDKFNSIITSTQQGGSLVDALNNVPEIKHQTIQILLAGEKSGKLTQSILQHVKIEKQNIDRQDDLIADWVPRIFYFMVSIWVASSVIPSV